MADWAAEMSLLDAGKNKENRKKRKCDQMAHPFSFGHYEPKNTKRKTSTLWMVRNTLQGNRVEQTLVFYPFPAWPRKSPARCSWCMQLFFSVKKKVSASGKAVKVKGGGMEEKVLIS